MGCRADYQRSRAFPVGYRPLMIAAADFALARTRASGILRSHRDGRLAAVEQG